MLDKAETLAMYNRIVKALTGNSPSSHGKDTHSTKQNIADWFSDDENARENADNPFGCNSSKAYLIAYVAIAGDTIPTGGITTSGGEYLHLDKAKIISFVNHEILSLENDNFILTELGRNYILGNA